MNHQKLFDLVADADELLARLNGVDEPESRQLRERVLTVVQDAKLAMKQQARRLAHPKGDTATHLLVAVAGAVVVGALVGGFIVKERRSARRNPPTV